MRRLILRGLAVLVGALILLLGGCLYPPQPSEPPPPPEPSPPAPQPVLGILMEGERLPETWWPPLGYGHYYEGQYITFSLVAEDIEPQLVEWWVWPDDRPDVVRRYEGHSFRAYFYGWTCSDSQTGPRPHTVLCRVTDGTEALHELQERFWIHRRGG